MWTTERVKINDQFIGSILINGTQIYREREGSWPGGERLLIKVFTDDTLMRYKLDELNGVTPPQGSFAEFTG